MTNAYTLTLASALLCLTVGCNRGGGVLTQLPPQEQTSSGQPALLLDDRETYAVYDALLGGPSMAGANQTSDTIAILDHTKIGISCSDLSMTIDPRLLVAGRDFAHQNSTERILNPERFGFSHNVKMISSKDLDRIFAHGAKGWSAFHALYPELRGYMELSAVGFGPGKNFAVVYSAVHCGKLCGAGSFITLTKSGGIWRKDTDRHCSWIS